MRDMLKLVVVKSLMPISKQAWNPPFITANQWPCPVLKQWLLPPPSPPMQHFHAAPYRDASLSSGCRFGFARSVSLQLCQAFGIGKNETDEQNPISVAGLTEGRHDVNQNESDGKFVAAMALIIGTAVGPGILGLPAATLSAGLLPSTLIIVASWVYVILSILLIAEISFKVMEEQSVEEVSFTSLALHTLGDKAGCFIAGVYAMLNYALLVACIAGLGSIFQQWLPFLPPPFPFLLCPAVVAALLTCTSFKAIDNLNRALCFLMLVSITALLLLGTCFGRGSLVSSWSHAVWETKVLFPAIPVTVLTLGFHVITPVVCRVIGTPEEARKAILCAGLVPLFMVLAWNALVLGLAPRSASSVDPIRLLLSVSSSATPAVQAFAFSALGTTLIGYALSFLKQLLDTVTLFSRTASWSPKQCRNPELMDSTKECGNLRSNSRKTEKLNDERTRMLIVALVPPAVTAILHPCAFASALDFAGVYANCFLFGVLPPLMAWCHRYSTLQRDIDKTSKTLFLVPGGRIVLIFLISISLYLGLRSPKI